MKTRSLSVVVTLIVASFFVLPHRLQAADVSLPIDTVSECVYRIEVKKGSGWSRGTAFMVHPYGILATCQHVTDGGSEFVLYNKDGKRMPCRVAWSVPQYDVSFLMVDGDNYPALKLANRRLTDKNEQVFGIFNMLGEGMVSLRGFLSNGDYRIKLTKYVIPDGYLLDIPTEGGASGGPLLSADGEVLGVLSGTRGRQSTLALVVPVAYVVEAAKLTMNLKSERGLHTGMTFETRADGLYVTAVTEGSSAAKAGIREGDKILAVDRWEVRNELEYYFSEIAFWNEAQKEKKPVPVKVFTAESGEAWVVDVPLVDWKYPAMPDPPAELKPGLQFTISVSDDEKIRGTVPNLQSLYPKSGCEMVYTGFIDFPEDGKYVFTFQPAGTGVLKVGEFVIEKSQNHTEMEMVKAGVFAKGLHRFELRYKMDKLEERPPLRINVKGKVAPPADEWLKRGE